MGNHSKKRIGVLTGGGDCPGLNAVIRGVVKTAVRHHGLEAVGFEDGYEGLVLKRVLPLDYDRVSGILTLGGTILGTSNKANPFKWAAKGPDGSITFSDVSDGVLRYAQELGLESIVAIGGDGTMSIAKGLVEKGLHIVGVPKTIDNDIWGTDQTFGFDTAVAIATEAVDRIHTTAMAHHRVMVIEVMGRYAGWLALCAAMAGGGDVVLIP
ncbi:MAG TPA: ATP-dependent 6-phosphofructokinase, partial [bacterium]